MTIQPHYAKKHEPSYFPSPLPAFKWMAKVFVLFNAMQVEGKSASLKILNFADVYELLPNSRGEGDFPAYRR